jgi:hypothetical protein
VSAVSTSAALPGKLNNSFSSDGKKLTLIGSEGVSLCVARSQKVFLKVFYQKKWK